MERSLTQSLVGSLLCTIFSEYENLFHQSFWIHAEHKWSWHVFYPFLSLDVFHNKKFKKKVNGRQAWPRRGGERWGQSREGPRAPGARGRKRKRIRGGKGKGKETPGNELVCSCTAHPRRLGSGVEAHLKYVLFFFGEPSLPEHSLRALLALQEVGSAPLLHPGSGQPPPLNRAPYPGRGLCCLGARLRGLDWNEWRAFGMRSGKRERQWVEKAKDVLDESDSSSLTKSRNRWEVGKRWWSCDDTTPWIFRLRKLKELLGHKVLTYGRRGPWHLA